MTKRHEALMPLTHDHHHALAQARRAAVAAKGTDEERLATGREYLDFFQAHALVHFREEEEVLFPLLLERTGEPPPQMVTALLDHVRIHRMIGHLRDEVEEGSVGAERLQELATAFQEHIRMEEKELFPLAEQQVAESELQGMEFVPRDRTA